ncbi:CPBP family intramembrane glutamic endopeptidase [Olivibacter sp. CPCC 100613]|uniref:CPBP family intramembrane glutamic endopeptidase n=1 Tax=Olivibacter sp. CPCC 100613 TaxID=3079931 RepID=UPI002FF816BC
MNNQNVNQVIFDLGIIAFVVLFPHYFPLPFYSYSIVCFIAIIYYLRKSRKGLRSIGLVKNGITIKSVIIAILSALIWTAFMRWIYVPLISVLFTVPDYTEYDFIRKHISRLMITLVAAWIVGGFYEEIVFRGFINSLLEKYTNSFWLSACITGLLFGLYHCQQGLFGIIAATFGGLYWSFIYRYFGRNLWNSILSHAFFDTIALTLIYLGLLT